MPRLRLAVALVVAPAAWAALVLACAKDGRGETAAPEAGDPQERPNALAGDANGSGGVEPELRSATEPGSKTPPARVSDDELRRFWAAIDPANPFQVSRLEDVEALMATDPDSQLPREPADALNGSWSFSPWGVQRRIGPGPDVLFVMNQCLASDEAPVDAGEGYDILVGPEPIDSGRFSNFEHWVKTTDTKPTLSCCRGHECSGRGSCSTEAGVERCACERPWYGPNCQSCKGDGCPIVARVRIEWSMPQDRRCLVKRDGRCRLQAFAVETLEQAMGPKLPEHFEFALSPSDFELGRGHPWWSDKDEVWVRLKPRTNKVFRLDGGPRQAIAPQLRDLVDPARGSRWLPEL